MFLTPYYIQRVDVPNLNMQSPHTEFATLVWERENLDVVPNFAYHCGMCEHQNLCALDLTTDEAPAILAREIEQRTPLCLERITCYLQAHQKFYIT